ncbi:substrate-binding domain-containing protein [Microbacterium sp. AGC62]|uniref:substrate-binding domain-containing protein n=1 Tax=Microbacterium maritypicum TaxID=33918 RepID=UPI0035569C33
MTAVHPTPSGLTPRALKFEALAQELRRGIAAGSWPLGSLLPTEKQLVESTGYSLSTVRRAVDVLVDEGLILRRQGSGMYVSSASRQRTEQRTIGVLIPDTRLYFPTVLQGIEAGLSGSGTSIALATSQYDSRVEQEAIARFVESGVDGLLITPIISDDADPGALLRRLESIPIPVVMLERRIRSLGYFDPTEYVCSNHEAGAFEGVSHLHRLGHRRIALALRADSAPSSGVRRGYEASVPHLEGMVSTIVSRTSAEWLQTHADDVLQEMVDGSCTAALVFGDREATLLEVAAQRRGLRVPEDLAIVSYDDEVADVAPVPLTAVSPAKHRIGRMAAALLLTRITEGDQSPVQQISIVPRLTIRDSCGARSR